MENLDGKTAIVTGGSSGIGRAISLKLAKNNANVAVADLKYGNPEGEKPTHDKIQEKGGNSIFIETDVSQKDSVKQMIETTIDQYGKIDILVNNAGIHHSSSVTEETEEGWNQIMEVNLKGTFLCSKYVLSHMESRNIKGDIINIGSIAGLVGYGQSAAYCASKGAIVELTREMALDYGSEGININAVNPGVIKTSMTKELREDPETKAYLEENTVKSRLGEPEDVANAVLFLATSKSDFILGENLVVDGGWTAK